MAVARYNIKNARPYFTRFPTPSAAVAKPRFASTSGITVRCYSQVVVPSVKDEKIYTKKEICTKSIAQYLACTGFFPLLLL